MLTVKARTYGQLRELIKQKYVNFDEFARTIGIHPATLSAKLNSKSEWTLAEFEVICDALGVNPSEGICFFVY